MNQIVITKRPDGTYKVNIMGLGRTDETYYMPAKIIVENLDQMLAKLIPVENAI